MQQEAEARVRVPAPGALALLAWCLIFLPLSYLVARRFRLMLSRMKT